MEIELVEKLISRVCVLFAILSLMYFFCLIRVYLYKEVTVFPVTFSVHTPIVLRKILEFLGFFNLFPIFCWNNMPKMWWAGSEHYVQTHITELARSGQNQERLVFNKIYKNDFSLISSKIQVPIWICQQSEYNYSNFKYNYTCLIKEKWLLNHALSNQKLHSILNFPWKKSPIVSQWSPIYLILLGSPK